MSLSELGGTDRVLVSVGRAEQAELGVSELRRTRRVLGAVLRQALHVFQHLCAGKTVEHGVVVDGAGGDDVLALVLHDAVLLLILLLLLLLRSDNSALFPTALRLKIWGRLAFQQIAFSKSFSSSPIVFFGLRLEPGRG